MRTGTRTILTVALAALAAMPHDASAQVESSANTLRLAEGAASPPASIGELAWLAGYWRGEGLGGRCEELWTEPIDGRMFGIFTLVKDEGLVFSEAMTLVERDGSLVLRVKHFTPDFVGWEEKDESVDFPLVRLGDQEAYFNGLTFRRNADGTLTAYLVLRSQGERTEHAFRFERVSL